MPKSSAWATVDADQHVAVGRPHAAHGVTITPLAEAGKATTFAVEATTPDVPLSRSGLPHRRHRRRLPDRGPRMG